MIPRKYQVISWTLIQFSTVLLSPIFRTLPTPSVGQTENISYTNARTQQIFDSTLSPRSSITKISRPEFFSHYLLITPTQVPFSFSSFRGQSYEDKELLRLSGPNSSTITRTIKLEASGLQLKLAFLWNFLFWLLTLYMKLYTAFQQ